MNTYLITGIDTFQQDWEGGGKEKSVHLNLPSVTSHVAATHASLSQLQSEGRGPLTALLLPPPPSPGPHTAKEQWSQEPGAHLEPAAALLVYSDQKGGVVWTCNPKQSVGLLGGLPPLAVSLSTQIVYIHSRFVSDCRDLFLIATTQG